MSPCGRYGWRVVVGYAIRNPTPNRIDLARPERARPRVSDAVAVIRVTLRRFCGKQA
jgi:hypothetical protein